MISEKVLPARRIAGKDQRKGQTMWKRFEDEWPPENIQFVAGCVCQRDHDGTLVWHTEVCDRDEQVDTDEFPYWLALPAPKKSQL